MSAFVRTRGSSKGVRWQVLYRVGGRATPIRSAGTFSTASEAERVREQVAGELAACVRPTRVYANELSVYIAELGGLLKIGVSVDPERRCRELHANLLHTEPGGLQRERELHAKFAHLRVRGEFFKPGSRGEIRRYITAAERWGIV